MRFTPILAGLTLTGTCFAADTRPSIPDEWFRGQSLQPPAVQNDGAAPPAMGAQGASDFPQDTLHDWVVANARAAHARAMLHLAERQLDQSVRDAQWTFEQSREYQDAATAEKKAYDAYIAERQRALASVVNDPRYQSALRLRDELGDKLVSLRAANKGELPPEVLLTVAGQKLRYASDAHAMEAEALDKDDTLKSDREKMVQASAKVSELRARLDASIRSNPQILQARRNLEEAHVALITAEAYRDAAAVATALSTDFAYYRHRWDGQVAGGYVGDFWGPWGYRY